MTMSAPTVEPRYPASCVGSRPDGYRPGERVWVHRAGSWRPGVVLSSSTKAVTVRYRPSESRGTGVDTVTGDSIAARDDDDGFLDRLAEAEPPRGF